LTQDNNTEGDVALDESTDSPVMKALRKQIKDLEKQANSAPTRESIEAEVRDELARQSAISEQLIALGHPVGMSSLLKGQLGEAEVTRESVAEALRGIGYQVEVDGASSEPEGEDSTQDHTDLANVTGLSAKVRSAAQGGDEDDLMRKIALTTNQGELNALMAEAGLVQTLH
jgi:hypothetical protein